MSKSLLLVLFFIPFFSFSQFSTIELEVRTTPEPLLRDSAVMSWNQSQNGYSKLSPQAKDFLYWVNYARSNPKAFWDSAVVPVLKVFPPLNKPETLSLKQDLMKAGELPMFILNESLINTAQKHATDIASKNAAPSHNSTDGSDFGSRIKRANIKRCANENISVSSQSVLLSVLLLYLDIGLPDLGHRKSLLNPSLVETGIGTHPYGKDKDRFFIVQDLACSQQ